MDIYKRIVIGSLIFIGAFSIGFFVAESIAFYLGCLA